MKRPSLCLIGLVATLGSMHVCFASNPSPSAQKIQSLISQTLGDWSFERLDAMHQLADIYYTEGQRALAQGDYATAEIYFYNANTDSADNRAAYCCLRQAEVLRKTNLDSSLLWVDNVWSRYGDTPYLDSSLSLGAMICSEKGNLTRGSDYLNKLNRTGSRLFSSREGVQTRRTLGEACLAGINSDISSQRYGNAKELLTSSRSWFPYELQDTLNILEQTIEKNAKVDQLFKWGFEALESNNWSTAEDAFLGILSIEPGNEKAQMWLDTVYYRMIKANYDWPDRTIKKILASKPEVGMTEEMIRLALGAPDVETWPMYRKLSEFKVQIIQTFYYFEKNLAIYFEEILTASDPMGGNKVVRIGSIPASVRKKYKWEY